MQTLTVETTRYHADGFTIVRGVFSAAEIAELEAEAVRLFARKDLIDSDNIRCRWSNCAETGECRFDCIRTTSRGGRFRRRS